MDATTTLMELVTALNEHDINTAVERVEALHEWLHEKKGAMPDVKALAGLNRDGLLCWLTAFLGYFGDPDSGNEYAGRYQELFNQQSKLLRQ